MAVPAIFYVYCCESPVKPTHQVGQFYHMSFQNYNIAAIGEKNRQVCPHQSVAQIARDFRWRSNSPRSAYKIVRCVAGLSDRIRATNLHVTSMILYQFLSCYQLVLPCSPTLTLMPTTETPSGNDRKDIPRQPHQNSWVNMAHTYMEYNF